MCCCTGANNQTVITTKVIQSTETTVKGQKMKMTCLVAAGGVLNAWSVWKNVGMAVTVILVLEGKKFTTGKKWQGLSNLPPHSRNSVLRENLTEGAS